MITNHKKPTSAFKTKMCIYTKRLYHCWCVDYYIKFANRCTASLHSDKECPRPPYLTKCEVEKVGLCPFHSQEEEAKLVAAGIPNPGYTNSNPEGGNSQQAETVAKTRFSDPNPEAKSNQGLVEAEVGSGGEPRGSGIRTSKTFPQSPPPAAPYRRSDPVLEGRGVPNPWILSPKKLQRSKTSAQALPPPLPPLPRPESFQQSPSQEIQAVGVLPNPWLLSPKKLQRSKTSAQALLPSLPQRSGSFQLPPSQPLTSVPTPLHRSNTTTTTTTSPYNPIHASNLQRASTYTSTSTSFKSRTLVAGAKPVQVAIRDSKGFFIPPSVYQEAPPAPPAPPETEPDPPLQIHRSSTYSARSSIIDLPLQIPSQRSSTYSQRSSRSSKGDSIQTENPPILVLPRVSTSPTPERRSRVEKDREKERRKSNRVSFVYQKSDDEGGGEEFYPAPLQMQWRDGGVGEERKERRKSMRMGMPRAGVWLSDEEILYSGSEYDGGVDSDDEFLPPGAGDRNPQTAYSLPLSQPLLQQNQSMETPHTGVGLNEEELLYSGSDYDGDPEDSDSELISSRDTDRNMEFGKAEGKGKGRGKEEERGSVLFEMLYAHASLPQFQFQSPPAVENSMEDGRERRESRERRMSIKPLALGGKKGVGGGGEGKEVYTDSEYETEYVDTD